MGEKPDANDMYLWYLNPTYLARLQANIMRTFTAFLPNYIMTPVLGVVHNQAACIVTILPLHHHHPNTPKLAPKLP